MDHDLADRAQPSTLAQRAYPPVATYLICQNTLLRTGVSRILEGTRFAVADDKSGGCEVPDLVLLCDSLSREGSVETIRQLKAQYPGARLVALGDDLDPLAVQELCKAGLDGLCLTGMSPAAMCKALELVMLGERFVPGSLSLALIDQASAQQSPVAGHEDAARELPAKFSDREAQILQRLTTGASNKLIARELGLAEATVKVHIKAILRKAKAANRTQAAMWANQFLAPAPKPLEVELAG
jgi:two-component system, NarL family, nitrate/nitrite response regulator NarL